MYVVQSALICCLTVFVPIVKLQSVDCPDIENVVVYSRNTDNIIPGRWRDDIISGCIEAEKFSSVEKVTNIIIDCSDKLMLKKLGANFVRNMLHLTSIRIENCSIADIEPGAFKNVPKLAEIVLDGDKHSPKFVQFLKRDIFNAISSLTEIYINNLNIIHIREGAFSNLPKLKLISLRHNKLTVIDGNWFSSSNNIERLYLNNNLVQIIPNGVFRYLSNLLTLELQYNQVISIEEICFQSLSRLFDLYLNNNLIKNIPKGVFKPLSDLAYLHLEYNQITSIEADTFQGLTNLNNLDLSHNFIRTIQSGVFNDLSNLESLDLRYNQIISIEADPLNGLTNLQYLLLSNNLIQTIESGVFKHLLKLKGVFLEENQITSIQSGAFQGLRRLETLRIDNNKITSISAEVLPAISYFLSMKNNEINYFSEAFLKETIKDNLIWDVGGNPLVCSCFHFVLDWMYKNNIKMVFNYILNNYPVCVVDKNNTKVCPMTVQPKLTAYYKSKLFN